MTALAFDATTTTGTFSVAAAFTAGPGVTVLFGPSGAGKSVVLATVAGLLRPASGTVALDDRVVADPANGVHVRTQDRRIGMVFQQPSLLPHRSPLDNVAIAVRDRTDRAGRRAVAAHWLEQVHAAHLPAAPTATLSGGEQQRVALARALAGGPRVLLLDEPFSALDQANREAMRDLVRQLVDAHGTTALLVTHDVADVAALGRRVVRFEPGRTVAVHEVGGDHPPERLTAVLGLGG